ncbi:MAG: hypothetical protein N2114_05195 [Candidatus Goldbacteria bacterium]|nr:hypothetical protein [Candidatus Goldiibacteriota bacterium]
MSEKITIIHYTGGIESYLMLKYALLEKQNPILLFLNAKKNNIEYFRIPNIYPILKKHMKFRYIELTNKELQDFISLKDNAIKNLYKKIEKKFKIKILKPCFFLNDTEIDTLENKKNIIKKIKKYAKLKVFSEIYKKIKYKKEIFDNAYFIPISIHKKITKYKLGKKYNIKVVKNDIIKSARLLNTLVVYSKNPSINLKYKIINKSNYGDHQFIIFSNK